MLFAKINKILSNVAVKVLLCILLIFAPAVNLAIFGFLIFYYCFLRGEGKKHQNNLKKIGNPFSSIYFMPDVCNQLGKHCTTL